MTGNQNLISVRFATTQSAARQAIVATIAGLSDFGISQSRCGDIEIALAEAVNNVVEHACVGLPNARGCISCLIKGDLMIVEITDTGRTYPDARLPPGNEADLSGPISDLPEGGFGWFLIHNIAVNVNYERTDNQNRLILEFRIGETTLPP